MPSLKPDRLLMELCCAEDSKLSQDRKSSAGCKCTRVTKEHDASHCGMSWMDNPIQNFLQQKSDRVHVAMELSKNCKYLEAVSFHGCMFGAGNCKRYQRAPHAFKIINVTANTNMIRAAEKH